MKLVPSAPRRIGGGHTAPAIRLPRGPRAIHSVVVTAKSASKKNLLAKIEVYGQR